LSAPPVSFCSRVWCKKHLNVDSTWIIKGNHKFYPMGTLHSTLKARFGSKTAGYWVMMTTEEAGIKILALAYAWSQKVISYFLLTCGNTDVSPIPYRRAFEDLQVLAKTPDCTFHLRGPPPIDEHNKQYQAILGLEQKWPIKLCWTRLVTNLFGMCMVDMH
jgi:hypothetical protein